MTLSELKPGQSGIITAVGGEGALRRHFLDMGVIPGAQITLMKYAPMGDPMELRIHDYELTLRLDDAARIEILPSEKSVDHSDSSQYGKASQRLFAEHPGFGEEGRFHDPKTSEPLPKGTIIRFALVGNQNCGKTTLFNQLTGASQHVGNFPGVTVDQKSGVIRGRNDTLVTDLPGIYSLSPYTAEEIVSRDYILKEKPMGIINIADANSIERSLYLTLQLMELGIPMVLALNMMDELTGNGGSVDINLMERTLGIPVIPISAANNQGIDELVRHAYHVARNRECPGRMDFCEADEKGGAVHRCIHAVSHLIEDHAASAGIPARFAATKLIEGDPLIENALKLSQNEKETIEHIIITMEEEGGTDHSSAIADMRYSFILKLCAAAVKKPRESKEHRRSEKIDRFLTGRYTAIPIFIGIMALVFYLTFNVIGTFLQGLLERGLEVLTRAADTALTAAAVNTWLRSLVIDGIFNGVGSVISFLPVIVTLFFFLSILEDSGYMARIAFVMDKLLRKIGLSGRSIVPLLIGFGCTVPAVMATRTLPSARDRRMTIILTPYMSCTAKLPVYGFLTGVFFPAHAGLIMTGLYFLGILTAIIVAFVSKNSVFKGEAVPFVMELPNYRLPGARNVLLLLRDKAKDFLERAFTVILMATIVLWFLQNFDFRLMMAENPADSILASIAGLAAPLFRPLGLNDWRIVTSLTAGLIAKESVVSSISVLFGSTAALLNSIDTPAAAALLVFCLLYTPCFAAIAAIKRELGGKQAFWLVLFQCLIAWTVAFIVRILL